MNREIKFRAWDEKRKQFNLMDLRDAIARDDAYSLCGDQGTKWEEDRENSCTMNCKCELQQFTGLKDKDGKEIFIGDILIWEDDGIIVIKEKDELGFYYDMIKSFDENVCLHDIRFYRSEESCRVIGNIFENVNITKKKYWTKKRCEEVVK